MTDKVFRMVKFISPDRVATKQRSETDRDFDVFDAEGQLLVSGFTTGEVDDATHAEFVEFIEAFGGVHVEYFPYATPRLHPCCALKLREIGPDPDGNRRLVWMSHNAWRTPGPDGWTIAHVDKFGRFIKTTSEPGTPHQTWDPNFNWLL